MIFSLIFNLLDEKPGNNIAEVEPHINVGVAQTKPLLVLDILFVICLLHIIRGWCGFLAQLPQV